MAQRQVERLLEQQAVVGCGDELTCSQKGKMRIGVYDVGHIGLERKIAVRVLQLKIVDEQGNNVSRRAEGDIEIGRIDAAALAQFLHQLLVA